MKKFKNYLFDWDGTIIDAIDAHKNSFIKTISIFHPDRLDAFDYSTMKGRKTIDVFNSLGLSDNLEDMIQMKQSLYRSELAEGKIKLFPGSIEVFEYIKNCLNGRVYIVTGASCVSLKIGLCKFNLDKLIDGIVCGDDVSEGKPNPECYKMCMDRYGLEVSESCAIEDAVDGVISANSASLYTFGVNDIGSKNIADVWFPSMINFLQHLVN